jgi:hypothetical protein
MPRTPPFSESNARAAIARATSWAEALRFLGYTVRSANYRTLQRWARQWNIDTGHFDPNVGRRRATRAREIPLERVLVPNSTYARGKLKRRLMAAGLKRPFCEICGQGELWKGRRMSLVLDHINGVSDDHRLENLRMVCSNCAATLDTHCGRNVPRERICPGCKEPFQPRHIRHRYCSQRCWGAVASYLRRGVSRPEGRKVSRPSYDQLIADLESMSFLATGRKYGVSDNAVRKWLRWYEHQAERERGLELESEAADEQAA